MNFTRTRPQAEQEIESVYQLVFWFSYSTKWTRPLPETNDRDVDAARFRSRCMVVMINQKASVPIFWTRLRPICIFRGRE